MGDDIWNAEPALRPEEEIILRKLHDMLQSTADDLKLLSGELSKYHEPGVQVKSLPTPLDEDFNEKVHIEEIVNAKFHGYKVVDKSPDSTPSDAHKEAIKGILKSITTDVQKPKKVISTGIQVNQMPIQKKPFKKSNLVITQTRIDQIKEDINETPNDSKKNNEKQRQTLHKPSVAYNEVSFKNIEPKIQELHRKPLQVQIMPSINIRSELKEQKVLDLNIEPKHMVNGENVASNSNIAVISVQHELVTVQNSGPTSNPSQVHLSMLPVTTTTDRKEATRKVFKMSSCESSESAYNVKNNLSHREIITNTRLPPKQHSESMKPKRSMGSRKEFAKRSHQSLGEWKKKLNSVYGYPKSSRQVRLVRPGKKSGTVEPKPTTTISSHQTNKNYTLNNTEYIPYSKLTLGGVKVSDIEKQISDIPNRNNIALSPILDIMLSTENSFKKESPIENPESPKILNTSDENLLQEVLDIEKKVHDTVLNNLNEIDVPLEKTQCNKDVDDQDSYIDDFEDENSDNSLCNDERNSDAFSDQVNSEKSDNNDNEKRYLKSIKEKTQNKAFIKTLNLSFKNKVDTFEFVHSVDTQETGTQSNTTHKISLKETQTSPRNERCNVQPIHNDLWPSIDPKKEVEKLFQLEKEFIKKLIVDEYGDLLEENLNKPSTSKEIGINLQKNVVSSQKNTQTSPAHVKSVMTSPTRTKTKTTSPHASMMIDHQTSPMTIEEIKMNVDNSNDLAISINLSSPRFSLRLPQSSQEVISNIESHVQSKKNAIENITRERRTFRKNAISSSSSADNDYSSSDISSLGEIRFKIKKRLQKLQVPSISELSSSSSLSICSSDISDVIIPLRSEGEVSLGQINRRTKKQNISEGEMSLGRM